MIETDYKLLEDILKGERKEICCIYGPPASGKTTVVKEAAVFQSKKNRKVFFIDSEKSFSVERIIQLAQNDKNVLDNIFVLKPKDLKEQGKFIKRLLKLKDVNLVIIDTIGVYYRLELKKNVDKANKEIHRQFNVLSELCSRGVSILVTNQIYQNITTNNISIVGGNMFKNWSKCLIRLEKEPRRLLFEKPENKEVLFDINNNGLVLKR